MRQSTAALLLLVLLVVPRSAAAYSVLTHEAMIDAAWADHLEPLLKRRFPRSSAIELRTARAYAYGGSLIQDLGVLPLRQQVLLEPRAIRPLGRLRRSTGARGALR